MFLFILFSLFSKNGKAKDELGELVAHLAQVLQNAHPEMRWSVQDGRSTKQNGNDHELTCWVGKRPQPKKLADFIVPPAPTAALLLELETFKKGGERRVIIFERQYERAILDGLIAFASARKAPGFHIKYTPAPATSNQQ